jgi:hypothetical protein
MAQNMDRLYRGLRGCVVKNGRKRGEGDLTRLASFPGATLAATMGGSYHLEAEERPLGLRPGLGLERSCRLENTRAQIHLCINANME